MDESVVPWTILDQAEFVAPSGYMKLVTRRYRLPDGRESDWDLLQGGRTAAVLALTPEGSVVLVRQYRPGPGRVLDEMPGGFVEENEDVAVAARRELLEETGYVGDVQVVARTWLSASATTVRHVAVATGCRKVGEPSPTGDEFCRPHVVALEEFRDQLRHGDLTDADLGYLALDRLGLFRT